MNFSCGQWNPLPWHLTCTGELTPGGGGVCSPLRGLIGSLGLTQHPQTQA